MKILIKVTKEVLERSKFCNRDTCSVPHNCAIANAVRELFPSAAVYYSGISLFNLAASMLSDYDQCDNAALPDSALSFIRSFDQLPPMLRVNMKPFSFEIEVPEFVIQSIGINTVYKVLSESKTLEHVNPL